MYSLIKIVNPKNKRQVCLYGHVVDFRLSSKGGTPTDIDDFIDKHKFATEMHINKEIKTPIKRIYFRTSIMDAYIEIFTNWNIYLMDGSGETIEKL